jgi:hypothetical protein
VKPIIARSIIPVCALLLIALGAAFYDTFGGRACGVVGALVWIDLWIAGRRTA